MFVCCVERRRRRAEGSFRKKKSCSAATRSKSNHNKLDFVFADQCWAVLTGSPGSQTGSPIEK
jgi:hypothetical protein